MVHKFQNMYNALKRFEIHFTAPAFKSFFKSSFNPIKLRNNVNIVGLLPMVLKGLQMQMFLKVYKRF